MSRPETLRAAIELADKYPHGVRMRYMGGCRCMLCRAANSNYETGRALERLKGRKNNIVSAERARLHVHMLSKRGVGYKSVAKAAKVASSIMAKIRSGEKTQIRAETERKILQTGMEAARTKNLIDARETWRKIRVLLTEGFTKRSLAQRLGYAEALQFNAKTITAGNARKVARLYNELMAGGDDGD